MSYLFYRVLLGLHREFTFRIFKRSLFHS